MTDKRMTEDDVVARLESGMTIGIGGWGSRRKPMSIVRAILRSPLKDLTIAAYGGPDLGLLCAAGKVRRALYSFVSLDSIPLIRTSALHASPVRLRTSPTTRGCSCRARSSALEGALHPDEGGPRNRPPPTQ